MIASPLSPCRVSRCCLRYAIIYAFAADYACDAAIDVIITLIPSIIFSPPLPFDMITPGHAASPPALLLFRRLMRRHYFTHTPLLRRRFRRFSITLMPFAIFDAAAFFQIIDYISSCHAAVAIMPLSYTPLRFHFLHLSLRRFSRCHYVIYRHYATR